MNKVLLLLIGLFFVSGVSTLFFLPLVSSVSIDFPFGYKSNPTGHYEVTRQDGEESVFDVLFEDIDNSTLTKVTFKLNADKTDEFLLTTSTPLKDFKYTTLKDVSVVIDSFKTTASPKLIDKSYSIVLDKMNDFYLKFGDNSIEIAQTFNPSTDTYNKNITTDGNFSHLSLVDSSIVLYMPFDVNRTSNNLVYDYSNFDNDGTVFGATWNSTGGHDGFGAYTFDGANDYIATPDSASFTTYNFSAAVWVKRGKSIGHILTKGGDGGNWEYGLRGSGDTTPQINIWGNSGGCDEFQATSSMSLTEGSWAHVAFVYDFNNSVSLYVNGQLTGYDNTKASNCNFVSEASKLNIGRRVSSTYFNGTLDDVQIYNRTLSIEEIKALYNNQTARFEPEGTQAVKVLNITAGNNRLKITAQTQEYLDSNVQARIGYWDLAKGYNNTDSGLVGYWHFDNQSSYNENDTHVYDFSGNQNNGSVSGAVYNSSGKFGGAYQFDGVNDYVSLGDNLDMGADTDFSIFTWIKTSNTADYSRLVSKRDGDTSTHKGYNLDVDNNNKVALYLSDGDVRTVVTGAINVEDGNWHFVGVTADRDGNGQIYVDGNADGSAVDISGQAGDTGNAEYLFIGARYNTGVPNLYFNGTIDDVMIFNRSLSADEIKELYIKGRLNYDYTDYKELGEEMVISPTANYILPEFKLIADINSFYSPVLFSGALGNLTYYLRNLNAITSLYPKIEDNRTCPCLYPYNPMVPVVR